MKLLSGNKIKTIGVMSGTSLDGLDVAAVEFFYHNEKWSFSIVAAKTIPYSEGWQNALRNASILPGEKLIELHTKYGKFIASQINQFIQESGFAPELIASHGHTIFHQPEKQFTFQLGNGADIAASTGITTVADFRIGDVALGGQGAPLVPVGDKLLFQDFEYCLNLGGFANISFDKNNERIAYDICPVNIVLNYFAEKHGRSFDENGDLGLKGQVNKKLLEKLNSLVFYAISPPKSLAREWVEREFMKITESSSIPEKDIISTVYEHIAMQISKATKSRCKILVTGGGAYNSFLMEKIAKYTQSEIIIPSNEIVNYKEALIFSFLGVLRLLNINNCFASVTGAKTDSCAGIIFTA